MRLEGLRQTVGKDFMFYLHIHLRKLKDQESEATVLLFRGMYLLVRKLSLGYAILLDSLTFVKVKKYTMLSFLTLGVWAKLLGTPGVVFRIHKYLQEQNKFYEVDNTLKTLATALSKRFQIFDKYVELPVRLTRVFDLNTSIDRALPVSDLQMAQAYFETLGTLFENLYKMAEERGMNLNRSLPEQRVADLELSKVVADYSESVLMCYDLIGGNIMGDYYLNTRNTNLQKMLKLALYYSLEGLAQRTVDFISKECLFQMNSSDDVIQKVMMTSKIAINIAQCLPDLQTPSTWFSLLDFLENLHQNLRRFQKNMTQSDKDKGGVKVGHRAQTTFNSDVALTLGSITQLFNLSATFTQIQLKNLLGAVSKVIHEYLESRLKKKKDDVECICQMNLHILFNANRNRLEIISSEIIGIISAYLGHQHSSMREFGAARLVDLLQPGASPSDLAVLDLQIKLLSQAKEQFAVDDSGKLLEFFLSELGTYFEGLSGELADGLWQALFTLLVWAIQTRPITGKHIDRRN